MELRTLVDLPDLHLNITHNDQCLFIGSCFAQNVGNLFKINKLPTVINPTGTLFNPLSIAKSIGLALDGHVVVPADMFFADGLYRHYDFYTVFAHPDVDTAARNCTAALQVLNQALANAAVVFVTFGTAFVYRLVATGQVVANCHKMKPQLFARNLLTHNEIADVWEVCIDKMRAINPGVRVLFTVSPVRHLSDGASANSLSKATLLLSVHELANRCTDVGYLPVYEMFMDELRDYRFYAADMSHVADVAVDYVFERFADVFFSAATQLVNRRIAKVERAVCHRPFNRESSAYGRFCQATLAEIAALERAFPRLDFSAERDSLGGR